MGFHNKNLFCWIFTSTKLLLAAHICLSVRKIAQLQILMEFSGEVENGPMKSSMKSSFNVGDDLDSRKTLTIDLPNR